MKASELDSLVEEDIGLGLQDDSTPHRFLEVMYKPDTNNIVAPREAKKKDQSLGALDQVHIHRLSMIDFASTSAMVFLLFFLIELLCIRVCVQETFFCVRLV
jgi:hypothetical protein